MQLSCLANLVSHSGQGHKCFLSPVWILLCLAKCPEVVNTREHVLHIFFFLGSGETGRIVSKFADENELSEDADEIDDLFVSNTRFADNILGRGGGVIFWCMASEV